MTKINSMRVSSIVKEARANKTMKLLEIKASDNTTTATKAKVEESPSEGNSRTIKKVLDKIV